MQLISYWRHWWKRWSTWLLATLPFLAAAQQWLPSVQQYIPDAYYKPVSLFIAFCVFIALQIRQASLPNPQQNGEGQ